MSERILVVDNYDSFVYNLVQFLGEVSNGEIVVFRNDKITPGQILEENPTHVVISPGPCTPDEAGVRPILGVCLGFQSIGQAFGGKIIRGDYPVHGKTSEIRHDGRTIFKGIPNPFAATRYHSLVLAPDLPEELEETAWTDEGVVMGFRHREYSVEGVLFHPESILTEPGKDILRNFLQLSKPCRSARAL